jgi:hypothetical protein
MQRFRTPGDYEEESAFLRGQLDTIIINHRVDWSTALLYVLAEPHYDAHWYRRYLVFLERAATYQDEYNSRLVIAARAQRVGFQNSAAGVDLQFQAERSYSLMRPPRMGRRLIRWLARSGTA